VNISHGSSSAIIRGMQAIIDAIRLQHRELLHINIDFASVSEQTIIAAPEAGYRIRLVSLELSSANNVEVAVKSGSTTIRTFRGTSIALSPAIPLNLGTAAAFKLQATTADRISGGCSYYIEEV